MAGVNTITGRLLSTGLFRVCVHWRLLRPTLNTGRYGRVLLTLSCILEAASLLCSSHLMLLRPVSDFLHTLFLSCPVFFSPALPFLISPPPSWLNVSIYLVIIDLTPCHAGLKCSIFIFSEIKAFSLVFFVSSSTLANNFERLNLCCLDSPDPERRDEIGRSLSFLLFCSFHFYLTFLYSEENTQYQIYFRCWGLSTWSNWMGGGTACSPLQKPYNRFERMRTTHTSGSSRECFLCRKSFHDHPSVIATDMQTTSAACTRLKEHHMIGFNREHLRPSIQPVKLSIKGIVVLSVVDYKLKGPQRLSSNTRHIKYQNRIYLTRWNTE